MKREYIATLTKSMYIVANNKKEAKANLIAIIRAGHFDKYIEVESYVKTLQFQVDRLAKAKRRWKK